METDSAIRHLEALGYKVIPPKIPMREFQEEDIILALKTIEKRDVYAGQDGLFYISYGQGLERHFIDPRTIERMLVEEKLKRKWPDQDKDVQLYVLAEHLR